MKEIDQLKALIDMVSASSRLSIGLARVVYELLPSKEYYKIEVLLEAHNDALESLTLDLYKGDGYEH